MLEQLLKVRAGKEANIFKGPLADELKNVPASVVGLVLGEVPAEMRQGLVGGGPFQSAPERIRMELTRTAASGPSTARRMSATVRPLTYSITKGPEVAGHVAVVSFQQQIVTNATAKAQVTMTLKKDGNSWHITSIR